MKLLFYLLVADLIAIIVCSFLSVSMIAVALAAVALLLLFLLWRSAFHPVGTLLNGLGMLAAQDYNDRLRKVGVRQADKVVDLFNSLMDKLKNERLRQREQNNFLNLLVEASPMGVAILDERDCVVTSNPSFIRFCGLDGKMPPDTPLGALPSRLASAIDAIPRGGESVVRLGGTNVYKCYRRWFWESGIKRHFILIESLAEEVLEAERHAYETLIRVMSHEVNNSMGGVTSFLDTLVSIFPSDRDLCEVAESCSERCRSLSTFVKAYADVVKLPAPVVKRIDLNAFIEGMIPFVREMAGDDVEIQLCLSTDPVPAMIDPDLMQQVVVNIVKNSLESMDRKGVLKFSTSFRNEITTLEICDSGKGISDYVSSNLFRPFFTTKTNGQGLGLTLVGEILRRHNSSFHLRTLSPGVTVFTIHLKSN